jgi:hypothetical protein
LPPGSNVSVSLAVSVSGGQVTVSWPVSAAGYKLFSTTSLGSQNWAQVTSGISVSGDKNTYVVTTTDAARFFRLQK